MQFPPANLHQLSDHGRTNSGDVTRSRRRTDLQELFELQLYVSTATEGCCCNRVGGCLRLKGPFGSVRDRAGEMEFFIACNPLNMGGFIRRRFAGGDVLGGRGCAAKYDESAGSPYRESSHGLLLKRTMLPQASTTPAITRQAEGGSLLISAPADERTQEPVGPAPRHGGHAASARLDLASPQQQLDLG